MKKVDVPRLHSRITERVRDDLADARVDRVSLAVWQEDEELFRAHFGGASERSLFRMASMTKPVTTVAVMILVERGLLSLDDLVETYLPAFADREVVLTDGNGAVVGSEPARRPLTIRHLLCHTSGLSYNPRTDARMAAMTAEEKRTLENTLAVYAEFLLAFHPEGSQAYSGIIAWDLLVAIAEKVTGEDFLSFLTREIFVPCDMHDTTFVPTEEQWARLVPMHNRVDGKSVEHPMQEGCVFSDFPCTHYLGGAGLISSLEDYLHFALMLQGGGVWRGRRIVSEESIRAIATPQLSPAANPGSQPWGLGVRVIRGDEYGRLPAGSFGWSGAYGTHFWVDPVNRITAVYMKNSVYDGGSGAVTSAHFEEDVHASLA